MLAKLNFLQSKYFLLIALMAILSQPLSAQKSCDYRVFNIKTADKVTGIELLTQIADSCDFSIIVKDDFASTALQKDLHAINMKNLSLDEIFEVIIMDNNLFYEFNNKFLKISALETKSFKIDYITSVRTGNATLDASLEGSTEEGDTTSTSSSTNTITSAESFDFWPTLVAEITSVLNTGADYYVAQAPIVNPNAGLITITATKQQLDRVSTYIDALEKRLHKQVLIDVSILAVDLSKGRKTGIDWSKFDLSLSSISTLDDRTDIASSLVQTSGSTLSVVNKAVFTMTGLLDFLGSSGDTKVISSPKILTLNNQQALITIGDNINYRVPTESEDTDTNNNTVTYENKSIFIGVLLNITPEITEDGEIILRINPSVSNFKYTADAVQQTREIAPDTSEKKLSTVVKVQNNNTIILGGLITRNDGKTNSSVPLLSDIPVFGNAFKHSEDSTTVQELIFIITPRIIGAKDDTKATLKDLGFSKRIYEQ